MAKDYYLSKNIEIEKLIEQVMSGSFEPPTQEEAKGRPSQAAAIMGQKPEQIESLLRFLIYLVLHKEKMSPEEYKKSGEDSKNNLES